MRCKNCKDKFEPKKFLQKFCMEKEECISEFLKEMRAKNVKTEKKDWQLKKKVLIEKTMTHSDWLKRLEEVFNKFIRLRDKDKPCISCGTEKQNIEYHAGHFWPGGNYSFLRFHEDNVHKQCGNNCNKNKHGNVGEYRIKLIERIGLERVNYLDLTRHNSSTLTIDEVKEKIIIYKSKVKQLENGNI